MHFSRVNVTFYDEVNIIHDVITTPNPFPYTAKLNMIKLNKSVVEREIEYVHSAVVYQKYPRLENYQFSQPR